jgi:hypothetical protein
MSESAGPAFATVAPDPFAPVLRFAESVRHASWFAAVGQPVTDDERQEATDYIAAIGFAKAIVVTAPDWRMAEAITRDAHWTRAWWDAEERARAALLASAKAHGEHALMTALSRVTIAASDVVLGAASIAAARAGVADPALARVAAGAATQAAYQMALALAAASGDAHPFAIKYRLFAAGRWPLGLVGDAFYLF